MKKKFLEKHGIFVARVPGDDYISEKYIRITLGKTDELAYLLEVLKSL